MSTAPSVIFPPKQNSPSTSNGQPPKDGGDQQQSEALAAKIAAITGQMRMKTMGQRGLVTSDAPTVATQEFVEARKQQLRAENHTILELAQILLQHQREAANRGIKIDAKEIKASEAMIEALKKENGKSQEAAEPTTPQREGPPSWPSFRRPRIS